MVGFKRKKQQQKARCGGMSLIPALVKHTGRSM